MADISSTHFQSGALRGKSAQQEDWQQQALGRDRFRFSIARVVSAPLFQLRISVLHSLASKRVLDVPPPYQHRRSHPFLHPESGSRTETKFMHCQLPLLSGWHLALPSKGPVLPSTGLESLTEEQKLDTSTRKSIKGGRVPLTLLAVHKARVEGLHKSALWVSATASASSEHEPSLGTRGSSLLATCGRDPTLISRELWDLITTRQLTRSRTGTLHSTFLHFTSGRLTHFTNSLHPHQSLTSLRPLPHLQLSLPFASRGETKRTCFCGPPSHLTRPPSSCGTIGSENSSP